MNTYTQAGPVAYGNLNHREQMAYSAFALAESRRDILADEDRTEYGRAAVANCEQHIIRIANTLIHFAGG